MTQFAWEKYENGAVPHKAVQGGMDSEGSPLYVGRGEHKGGMHIGKVSPQHGGLLIGYGGKEVKLKSYEVLTGDANQLRWIKCANGALPEGGWLLVEGGWESSGEKLYIGKAEHEGGLQVGKAAPHIFCGMSFAYGSKELNADNYWVLVYYNREE